MFSVLIAACYDELMSKFYPPPVYPKHSRRHIHLLRRVIRIVEFRPRTGLPFGGNKICSLDRAPC